MRPFRIYSEMLPARNGFNVSIIDAWIQKFDCASCNGMVGLAGRLKLMWFSFAVMEKYNSTVVVFTGALPTLGGQCVVADAEGAKAVFTNKRQFGKPIEDYGCVCECIWEATSC